jgi:hypothetical protein
MQLTITNLTTSPVFIRDLYTAVQPGTPVVIQRSAGQLEAMTGLQAAIQAGSVSIALVPSAAETASQVYQVIDVANPDKLPSYTTAGRPVASTVPLSSIWNSTTGIPNFSNGAAWVDAAGAVV